MDFPNAQKGINKIIIATVISVVGTALIEIFSFAQEMAISAPAPNGNGATNVAQTQVNYTGQPPQYMKSMVIIGFIILVIAAISKIIGLWQAGKDEMFFKYALYTVAVSFCGGFFIQLIPDNERHTKEYILCVFVLATLVCSVFIVQAIINLAKKKNNEVIEKKGVFIFQLVIVAYLLMFALKVISNVLRDLGDRGPRMALETGVVVVDVIGMFLVLSLLINAKKMLTEQK